MVQPCPLIDVAGTPHARGLSHGQQAAERIKRGISHYAAQLKTMDLTEAAITGLVHDYLPVIDGFDPTYREEMMGIAEGGRRSVRAYRAAERPHRNPQTCLPPRSARPACPDRGPGWLHRPSGAAHRHCGWRGDPCAELGLEGGMRGDCDRSAHPAGGRAGYPDLYRGGGRWPGPASTPRAWGSPPTTCNPTGITARWASRWR